jgi:hypothetical protein
LINALPGNSSVNTVQEATIEKVVFSVDPTDAPIDWLKSDQVTCVFCDACPSRGYISKSPGFRAVRVAVVAEARKQVDSRKLEEYSKQAVSWRSREEYRKSACEDLMCDLKTFCVL